MKQYLTSLLALIALIALLAAQPSARAHYIWATIADHKARFALLETLTESPDPKFTRYVETLAPQSGGVALPSGELKDGARYAALTPLQTVVVADSIVGPKSRDGGPEYLLIYHAKGAASLASAADDAHQPEEITARKNGDNLIVTVRHNGKPVPQNDVTIEWPGCDPRTLRTDASGNASLTLPQSMPAGYVGIRTMIVESKSGETAGTRYVEIHHWATLTFPTGMSAN